MSAPERSPGLGRLDKRAAAECNRRGEVIAAGFTETQSFAATRAVLIEKLAGLEARAQELGPGGMSELRGVLAELEAALQASARMLGPTVACDRQALAETERDQAGDETPPGAAEVALDKIKVLSAEPHAGGLTIEAASPAHDGTNPPRVAAAGLAAGPAAGSEGSLDPLAGGAAARLDELRGAAVPCFDRAGPSTSIEPLLRGDLQDILREIAALRRAHEEAARRAGAAFCAIQKTLENIAGLCARIVAGGREPSPSGWSAADEALDPFAPILTELKRQCHDGPLAMGRRAGGKSASEFGPQAAAQPTQESSLQEPLCGAVDQAGFLIEPGLGFPPRREPAGTRVESMPRRPSEARDEPAHRAEFIPAARRAVQMATAELAAAIPAPAGEGTENHRGSRAGNGRRPFARRWLAAAGLAVLAAAAGLCAMDRTLIRSRLGNFLSGFLTQRQADSEPPRPGPARQAANEVSHGSSLGFSPASAPSRARMANEPGATFSGGNAARAARLDPLAPAEPRQRLIGSAGGKVPPRMRAIAGSDPIVAEDLRPVARGPSIAAGSGTSAGPLAAAPAPAGGKPSTQPALPRPGAWPDNDLFARAEAGDAGAQFEVAARQARDQKYELAARWYAKAAQQGHPIAQHRLATLYERGLGVEKNIERAKDWYRRAAENGNIRAMHNLGVLASEGSDGKPDYASAALWFGKAAEYGLSDSQYNFAVLLARGLGVPKDLVKSYTWFAIVAAGGDEEAARKRDEIAARLTASELAAAKAAAEGFVPRTAEAAANETPPPSGGRMPPSKQGPSSRKSQDFDAIGDSRWHQPHGEN